MIFTVMVGKRNKKMQISDLVRFLKHLAYRFGEAAVISKDSMYTVCHGTVIQHKI